MTEIIRVTIPKEDWDAIKPDESEWYWNLINHIENTTGFFSFDYCTEGKDENL